jgi:TolA-binding protein
LRTPFADLDDRQRQHLESCADCSAEAEKLRTIRTAVRDAPTDSPSADRLEQVRDAIVASAANQTRRERRRTIRPVLGIALVIGAAAAGALFAVVNTSEPPHQNETHGAAARTPINRGLVRGRPGAHFHLASAVPDERVELYDGTIEVEVAPLEANERFRVVTRDGEVEVRGTMFEATAASDHLLRVEVKMGRVEVRHQDRTAILEPGETWHAPDPTPALAPDGARAVARPKATKPSGAPRAPVVQEVNAKEAEPSERGHAEPEAAATSPAETAFDEGFQAMRGSEFAKAASAFDRAISAEPDGAVAEDARYWRAVALARAGDPRGATKAIAEFLDQHPHSVHRGEASVMLGWLVLEAGDLDRAEALFSDAKLDVLPQVRKSAESGLSAIRRRRGAAWPPSTPP